MRQMLGLVTRGLASRLEQLNEDGAMPPVRCSGAGATAPD